VVRRGEERTVETWGRVNFFRCSLFPQETVAVAQVEKNAAGGYEKKTRGTCEQEEGQGGLKRRKIRLSISSLFKQDRPYQDRRRRGVGVVSIGEGGHRDRRFKRADNPNRGFSQKTGSRYIDIAKAKEILWRAGGRFHSGELPVQRMLRREEVGTLARTPTGRV